MCAGHNVIVQWCLCEAVDGCVWGGCKFHFAIWIFFRTFALYL